MSLWSYGLIADHPHFRFILLYLFNLKTARMNKYLSLFLLTIAGDKYAQAPEIIWQEYFRWR